MRTVYCLFLVVFLTAACATTPVVLPEKYNLDNYLEAVKQIKAYKIRDFENVDNQSVILEVDRHEYYLLVLRQPMDIEHSNLSVDIENTVSKDRDRSTQEIIGSKITNKGVPSTEFVQAPSKIIRIVSGQDRIIVTEKSVNRQYYVVEKIYKLSGRTQAIEIKERLRQLSVR